MHVSEIYIFIDSKSIISQCLGLLMLHRLMLLQLVLDTVPLQVPAINITFSFRKGKYQSTNGSIIGKERENSLSNEEISG